MGMNITESRLR